MFMLLYSRKDVTARQTGKFLKAASGASNQGIEDLQSSFYYAAIKNAILT
jgi:hypothetical protein